MKEIILQGSQIKSHIYIQQNLIAQADKHSLGNFLLDCICIITDTNVGPLYLQQVKNEFQHYCKRIITYVVSAGEEYKTLETVGHIYGCLAENQFGRNDGIIALGGGVVGDMAGFVAATYLRGISTLIQIPTTLLAQVDSSVGGKCGVDLLQGKNLVGAFRQPDQVFVDVALLKSLKRDVFASGLAEVIKYGCIFNEKIIETAENCNLFEEPHQIEGLVSQCIEIKTRVVEEDEFEKGDRKLLNFGHTVGHAIEKLGNFTEFSHGEAVSIGMISALKMGEKMGITQQGSSSRIEKILKKYELPVEIGYPMGEVFKAMMSDKKRQGNELSFIFSEKIGKGKIVNMKIRELEMQMKGLGGE